MGLNPASVSRLCVRETNWLGDCVMSLPALRALRKIFPRAHLTVAARPAVAELFTRESAVDRVIPYTGSRLDFAARLRREGFDAAVLFQNAFDAALLAWLARIPERIGYNRDGRGWLLTCAVPLPEPGEIPRHQRFYYLELLRRAGWLEGYGETGPIRLDGMAAARAAGRERLAALGIEGPAIGISPGAAYGGAKRYDRFAEAARALAADAARTLGGPVSFLVFGSPGEADLCQRVSDAIPRARNLAGRTRLPEFIEIASACRLFLTNDSGAMHVVSAAETPTLAIFGATDDTATGPAGPFARVLREHAECAPCLLRECPIDHRCMARVAPERVAEAALELLGAAAGVDHSKPWTRDTRF